MTAQNTRKQWHSTPDERSLNVIDKMLVHKVMFEMGIVPILSTAHDIRRALDALPPDEARRMKRRFRKLWRKYAKKDALKRASNRAKKTAPDEFNTTYMKLHYGAGKTNPSKQDRLKRKDAVATGVWNDSIEPLREHINNQLKTNNES